MCSVLGMFSLKNFLFNVSPQCREAQADACARGSKSPAKGDPPGVGQVPSASSRLNCVGTSLRMTCTAGGTVPAYPVTGHSKAPAYAGSHYSPTPIVILRERTRTNVSEREPKDLSVLGMFSLKAILFGGSAQRGEGFFRGSPQRKEILRLRPLPLALQWPTLPDAKQSPMQNNRDGRDRQDDRWGYNSGTGVSGIYA